MATQQMIKLQARKETIDTGKVGLFSSLYPVMTDIDVRALDDAVSRFTIAQALIDNISNVEGGITIRPIMPDLDFLDGAGGQILSRDWRQPVANAYTTATGTYASNVVVYKTGTVSKNDRKVISLYGIKYTGSGPNRAGLALKINSIIIKRSDVKLIDQWHVQGLETNLLNQGKFAKTPVMFKRGDDMAIHHIPDARHAVSTSKFDMLEYVGLVAESLGSNMTG